MRPPVRSQVRVAARGATVLCGLVLGAGAGAASAPAASATGWLRPVDGHLVRAFAVGPDRFAAGQHRGIDLAAASGATVRAACGGRVGFAGTVPGGGRTVSVRCGALVATYQHLGWVAVGRGRVVAPGARIGTVGAATVPPHLHLGAREAATGRYVDPLGLLSGPPGGAPAALPRSVRAPPLGRAPRAGRRAPAPARRSGPARAPARAPAPVAAPAPAGAFAPAPRPAPGSPAPAASGAFAPAPRPAPGSPAPALAPEQAPGGPGPARLPWTVWAGLALVGLGLPLGAMMTVRRRPRAALSAARTAS